MKVEQKSNQIEYKYCINENQIAMLMEHLKNKFEPEKHHKYTVYTIYYETLCNELQGSVNSIAKRRYRLRSYGIPSVEDFVYLEVKHKNKEITNKRRYALTQDEAIKVLNESVPLGEREIDELIIDDHLIPFCFVGYERIAYRSISNPKIRITFSMNIRYRYKNFWLCDLVENNQIKDDFVLLEIKGESIPNWLINDIEMCGCKTLEPQYFNDFIKLTQN